MKFWEALEQIQKGKKVKYKNPNPEGHPYFDWDVLMETEWELYQEPVQMLSFQDVVKGLKEGKKFRRNKWPVGKDFTIHLIENFLVNGAGYDVDLGDIRDFEATDWVEVDA